MKSLYLVFGVLLIGLCFTQCNSKEKSKAAETEDQDVPVTFLNQDKKISGGNMPDESAYLPFCLDSANIPKIKKKFCAQKILSTMLIDKNPAWNDVVGVVYIKLTIESDGRVSEVVNSEDFTGHDIGNEVARQAYEILKDNACRPATKKGFRIKSKLIVPIYFGLKLLDDKILQ